jgi:peptide/nickel transport system substrate-binding protein
MKSVRLLGVVCILSILAAVSVACAADEPTAPSAPQQPAAAAPAAPAQAGAGAAVSAPQQPAAPQAAAAAAPAITAVPVAPQVQKLAPPTPVPTPVMMATESDWVAEYLASDGYKPEWGQPVYGGILRYGANLKLNGHDPNYGHTYEGPQFLPTYNSLIKFDPWQGLTGPILPDLATTWDISGDGTVITFELREGIRFQDNPNSTLPSEVKAMVAGDEFTCEDAAASLQFAIYPPQSLKDVGVTHAGPRLGLSHLKDGGATCPDGPMGYTLRAEFKEARAGTIGKFAGVTGMPNNMDKDLIAWWSAECPDCFDQTTDETYLYGTGTGAFIPFDRTQDVGTKIRANPDYWREGLPFLEGVDHIEIEDATTRFTALITGQTDYYGEGSASLLPGQVSQVLERYADDIHLEPVLHLWGKGLQYNMHREPFNDVRVRTAIHLGIDREDWVEINRIEGGGQNVVGVIRPTNWMPPGTVWALPDDELWAMPGFRNGPGEKQADIDEANRLLDEAGLTGSPRFTAGCMTTPAQIFIDGCLYFKDQLKKNLDIEMKVDVVEEAVQRQRGQTGHGAPPDYDVHYGSKARTDVADPSDFYNIFLVPETESWYHRGTGRFQADPDNAQKLLDLSFQQAVELDPAKRREIVHEIERLSIETMYMVPMPWSIIWPAWHTDVRGWRMFNHPSQIKWAGWERAWLAR